MVLEARAALADIPWKLFAASWKAQGGVQRVNYHIRHLFAAVRPEAA
jgi:hypothetical protein